MSKDVIYVIRKRFDEIVEKATRAAEQETQALINSLELNKLNIIDQLIKIRQASKELDNEHEALEYPGYSEYHTMENGVYKLFATRLLFYNVDESEGLNKTIIHDAKRRVLFDLWYEKRNLIPKFTFASFLSTTNPVYAAFYAKNAHNEVEEFMKIRNWQSETLNKIVELETAIMVQMIRAACRKSEEPESVLGEVRRQFDLLKEAAETDNVDDIIARANEMLVFNHPKFQFGGLAPAEWANQFQKTLTIGLNFNNVIPTTTRQLLKEYKKHPKYPISAGPFIFYALQRCKAWLDAVTDGDLELNENLKTDFSADFERAYTQGTELSETNITRFQASANLDIQTKEQYRESLFDRLDELRHEAKTEHFEIFYQFIKDKEQTLQVFKHSCFYESNTEQIVTELTDVVRISEELDWLSAEIFEIDGRPPFRREAVIKDENERRENDLIEIMNAMKLVAIDHDLYTKLSDATSGSIWDFHSGIKPMYFVMMDTQEAAQEVFREAMSRLHDILERQPQTSKIIYIQDRLKMLRHRELDLKQFGWKISSMEQYLKEFMEIEADFIRETRDISFTGSVQQALISYSAPGSPFSFGYKLGNTKALSTIYRLLNLKINFINEAKTSEADFIKALTAKDLEKIEIEIHLGCETTQFSYILDKMKPLFSNFNPTSVEKSFVFYSKNGKHITRSNLYSNKIDAPKNVEDIDKVFQQLQ